MDWCLHGCDIGTFCCQEVSMQCARYWITVYSATIDVPSDTTKLEFSWQQGAWDSEVIFTITDPLGRVVLSVQYPTAGGDLGYEPCDWVD